MEGYVSVSEAAAEIGCKPRDVSDLIYHAVWVEKDLFPLVAGRRLVPKHLIPAIADILQAKDKAPAGDGAERGEVVYL